MPAACCGLVGLKPTRNRNTFAPFGGEGLGGASTEHAVSLSVRDSAALLDATAGPGAGDPYFAPSPPLPFAHAAATPPARLRIAWTTRAPSGVPVDAECVRLVEVTAQLCADLGHQVEQRDPAVDGASIVPTFLTLASANTLVNLASHPSKGRSAREDEVERITWLTAQRGARSGAPDYVRATQSAHHLGRQMAAFHSEVDVLLTPGLATPAVKLGWLDMGMDDFDEFWQRVFAFSPFTVWFNLTGQPGLMLPLAHSESGLPLAVQLVGRYADEFTLIQLGAQLESARPWFGRKPPVAAAPA